MPRRAVAAETTRWALAFQALARGHDPVLVLDADGRVMRLSRPLGGLRPSDIMGRALEECVRPPHARSVAAAVRHAMHPGIPQVIESAVPSGAGNRWYRFHLTPWPDDEVVLVQCTDVDAQRAEKERLQAVERLTQDTQGITHMGVWTWDITKPHAEWSKGLYAIYGLDPATHVPTYEDYLTRVHPDDVERVRAATEAVFNDQEPYSHDERIRHSDGSWRHLHTWARPIMDEDGKLVALQGICMDITERKEAELALARSEARQKAIREHAGLGIATIGPDGLVEDANPAFFRLVGRDAAPGRIDEVLGKAPAAAVRDHLQRLLGGLPGPCECLVPVEGRWVRLVMNAATNAQDPFVVVIAQDVTAEHAAEQAAKRIRELEAAGRERARRLGMASHEIKNPLTPMLLQMELLRHAAPNMGQREQMLVDRITAQVQRLDRLVRDFLDTARAEEGGLPIHSERVELVRLATGVIESHRPMADALGVGLRMEAPHRASVDADAGRIAQVLDNLLGNALRFTSKGGQVEIAIEARSSDHRVTVRDNGVGIPKSAQGKLFVPYADNGVEAVNPGASTGLGLYVCKAIVEAHGGAIGIASTPGQGTTAWFTIPRRSRAQKA